MATTPSRRRRRSTDAAPPGTQLALALAPASGTRRHRGGPRQGAGSPRTGRTRVAHRPRPALAHRHPVHVTLRALRGLPSFRTPLVGRLFARVFREVSKDRFAVAHYSLQANHVHLVVEAQDRQRLSSGVRRLVIRAARRLNLLLGRAGRIWAERYHRHDLRTPREVRNALVYVLTNAKKHGALPHDALGHDPYSSAHVFDGWSSVTSHAAVTGPPPVIPPRTWLLRIGWRRHGLVEASAAPASARASRSLTSRHPVARSGAPAVPRRG